MSATPLEIAILSTSNANGVVGGPNPSHTQLLNELISSSNGWMPCVDLLARHLSNVLFGDSNNCNNSDRQGRDVIAFYALSTIQSFLQRSTISDPGDRARIRQILFSATAASNSTRSSAPNYIMTKISVVIALLVKSDYNNNSWPSCFSDVLSLRSIDPHLFLKVLGSLVDEVFDFREGRSR